MDYGQKHATTRPRGRFILSLGFICLYICTKYHQQAQTPKSIARLSSNLTYPLMTSVVTEHYLEITTAIIAPHQVWLGTLMRMREGEIGILVLHAPSIKTESRHLKPGAPHLLGQQYLSSSRETGYIVRNIWAAPLSLTFFFFASSNPTHYT